MISGVGSTSGGGTGRGPEARVAYAAATNVTNQAIQSRDGVRGTVGSTGPARGINGGVQIEVQRGNSEPSAVKFDAKSGSIRFQIAEGAGGETSANAQTPNPPFPTDANRAALKGTRVNTFA